jgi:hypothetical protein
MKPQQMKRSLRFMMTSVQLLRGVGGLIASVLIFATGISAQSGRCWMNGLVLNESDTQGISGATVELIGDSGAPQTRDKKFNVTTDARGKYSLERLPYGEYTFRVSAPGYGEYKIPLYLASDALTQLHVKLKRTK